MRRVANWRFNVLGGTPIAGSHGNSLEKKAPAGSYFWPLGWIPSQKP
jgi:hypothetical protein